MGRKPKDVQEIITPTEAIYLFCLECMGGMTNEVFSCTSDGVQSSKCFLYDLRFSKAPRALKARFFDDEDWRKYEVKFVVREKIKRELTEEQRQVLAERIANARKQRGKTNEP